MPADTDDMTSPGAVACPTMGAGGDALVAGSAACTPAAPATPDTRCHTSARAVHLVVPDRRDAQPSGGDVYDARVGDELAAAGRPVTVHRVAGGWPWPDDAARGALAAELAAIPDGAEVLLDGLVGSAAPETVCRETDRLVVVVLVHMLLGEQSAGDGATPARLRDNALPRRDSALRRQEETMLQAAAAVITTSRWTRERLARCYPIDPVRLHAIAPGARRSPRAKASPAADRLLCVGAVAPHKGQDVLIAALGDLHRRNPRLPWRCRFVGSLTGNPPFAEWLRNRAHAGGIADRVEFTGTLTGRLLDAAYARADLLVVPSRAETYGMVVTEALARAIPVIAGGLGGLPEALGVARGGGRPGMLVPPGNPAAFSAALDRWLTDGDTRHTLRDSAAARRDDLDTWEVAAARVAAVLVTATGRLP